VAVATFFIIAALLCYTLAGVLGALADGLERALERWLIAPETDRSHVTTPVTSENRRI
jgi:hypothetical protein